MVASSCKKTRQAPHKLENSYSKGSHLRRTSRDTIVLRYYGEHFNLAEVKLYSTFRSSEVAAMVFKSGRVIKAWEGANGIMRGGFLNF
jgi:hypothetical protein